MAFGQDVKRHQKEKAERIAKERKKKFPRADIVNKDYLPVHRHGAVSPEEKAVVQLLVQDQPHELSKEDVDHLAALMHRPVYRIKDMIENARGKFMDNAEFYVEAHRRAIEGAVAAGEHEAALKHIEWAITNLTHEGARVLEAVEVFQNNNAPPAALIGINLGGMIAPKKE